MKTKILAHYCQCDYHQKYRNKPWYYFGKYFSNISNGCLLSISQDDETINETRKYIQDNNILLSSVFIE